MLRWFSKSAEMSILIDCGAFTEFMAGKPAFPVEKYIEWLARTMSTLQEFGEIHGYMALDVIGNAEATMTNYEKMLDAGLQPIPIITRGVESHDIDRMVDTAPSIALGGIFGTTMKERSALRWMIDQLPEGYPQHWLGFTDGSFVRHYRPTSFDSSNWVSAERWGRLHNYLGNFQFSRGLKFGLTLNRQETRNIRSIGFDPSLLGIPDNWRTKKQFNLVQCIQTAMHLRWMRDLEALNVKMFFACVWINRGVRYNLFQQYIHNGEDCIGLPMVATV